MQDRYAGDIGDYGKFGLLKTLEQQGLLVGVNWYLTTPALIEQRHEDGRHRIKEKYFSCDPELAAALYEISSREPGRSVEALERAGLLKNALFYNEPVGIKEGRAHWHSDALEALRSADAVFLDPDNGLLVKSIGKNSKRAGKYIFDEELRDYLIRGQAVIFYQHRPRKRAPVYFGEMNGRIQKICEDIPIRSFALTFPKCTVRDYFILCPEGRCAGRVEAAVKTLLSSEWGRLGLVIMQRQYE